MATKNCLSEHVVDKTDLKICESTVAFARQMISYVLKVSILGRKKNNLELALRAHNTPETQHALNCDAKESEMVLQLCPDRCQNRTESLSAHVPAFHQVLWKSALLFLRNPAEKPTNEPVEMRRKHNFLGPKSNSKS